MTDQANPPPVLRTGALTPINPEALGKPVGYSNGMLAPAGGRLLFVAGQVAWDAGQNIISDDLTEQFRKALENMLTVVREAGGDIHHIGRLTFYVTSREEYLAQGKDIGVAYREVLGYYYPAMSLFEISKLVDDRAKVEVEATAVIPAAPTAAEGD